MRSYLAPFKLGIKRTTKNLHVRLLLDSILFFSLLYAYGHIYRGTSAEDLASSGFTANSLFWYFGVGEVIFMMTAHHWRDFDRVITESPTDICASRPFPYVYMIMVEWVGRTAVILPSYLALVFGLIWGLTGVWVIQFKLTFILSLLLASLIGVSHNFLIGVMTYWFKMADPFALIWGKAIFLLGGMILPLTFYPPFLKTLALCTPFAALISGPGYLALGKIAAWKVLELQICWLGISFGTVYAIYHYLVKQIEEHGG